MLSYGIIGKYLGHSFSPEYFQKKFQSNRIDAEYKPFEIDSIEEFPKILEQNSCLHGLNVTIPYKSEVIPFLNEIDQTAQKVGAVNTIQFLKKDEKPYLKGFNTDVIGFEQSLVPFISNRDHIKTLVLGTGGASRAVIYVLQKLGMQYLSVSRNPNGKAITYDDLTVEVMHEHLLIIQTTPLGMFPDVSASPSIPYEYLSSAHLLYDLVYNPEETLFLQKGKFRGTQIQNGLKMLEIQAEASWKIWQESV